MIPQSVKELAEQHGPYVLLKAKDGSAPVLYKDGNLFQNGRLLPPPDASRREELTLRWLKGHYEETLSALQRKQQGDTSWDENLLGPRLPLNPCWNFQRCQDAIVAHIRQLVQERHAAYQQADRAFRAKYPTVVLGGGL